jgi:STAS-like domain of unknown function (DUF4325)
MIHVANDFSRTPAGRYPADGPANGQKFRDELLVPELAKNDILEIVLDGTAGYPSSFLDEAFGGLIRNQVLSAPEAKRRLLFIATSPSHKRYVNAIWSQVDRAEKQLVEQH